MKFGHLAITCLVVGSCIAPASSLAAHAAPPAASTPEAPLAMPAATASSAPAETIRIVSEDQRKQWWVNARVNPPPYPRDAIVNNVQGCIAIACAIHADGTATPLKSIKSFWTVHMPTITKQLERLTTGGVAQWHFSPAPANASRAPVLTCSVVAFTTFMPDEAPTTADQQVASDRMKTKCAVPNFTQDMQKLLESPTSSGNAG